MPPAPAATAGQRLRRGQQGPTGESNGGRSIAHPTVCRSQYCLTKQQHTMELASLHGTQHGPCSASTTAAQLAVSPPVMTASGSSCEGSSAAFARCSFSASHLQAEWMEASHIVDGPGCNSAEACSHQNVEPYAQTIPSINALVLAANHLRRCCRHKLRAALTRPAACCWLQGPGSICPAPLAPPEQ